MRPGWRSMVGALWLAGWGLAAGCRPAADDPAALPPAAPRPEALSGARFPALPRPPREEDWFEDVTARSGVDFAYRNGREGNHYTLLETVGGGVALLDFDRDGDVDLYFAGGGTIGGQAIPAIRGRGGRLYRNDGDWRFSDVTPDSGLDSDELYTHGATVLDYNRDRLPDLLVTGFGGCRLYRNRGQGKFEDVTAEAGVTCSDWCTASAAADVDRDGWVDIFIASYVQWSAEAAERRCGDAERGLRDVCPPQWFPGTPDRLFRNRGDGRFENISAESGITLPGRGLGVVAADLNQDGWIDFYVANDAGANFLYLGNSERKFREAGIISGVAYQEYGLPEGSMGIGVGDYNGDRRPDLFVTNFEMEENALYRGDGRGLFTHASVAARLAGPCFPYVGFGTGFADFDSDGWQDLFVVNGNVFYQTGQSPYEQPPFVFQNQPGGRFRDVSLQAGPYFGSSHVGRGAAVGDLDNDGAPDLVVVHQNAPVTLLRNRRTPEQWLSLQLEGETSEPFAAGAEVRLRGGARERVRWVTSGEGYLSSFDRRLLLPLEAEGAFGVTVRWPSGRVESFDSLQLRTTNELVEGTGRAETAPQPEER